MALKTRLFLAKSDALTPECTDGGGGPGWPTGLGNFPKQSQVFLVAAQIVRGAHHDDEIKIRERISLIMMSAVEERGWWRSI